MTSGDDNSVYRIVVFCYPANKNTKVLKKEGYLK